MYQMRQWYKPLAELAKLWPVVVLSRTATGARALLAEDAPPVAFVPTVRDLERFIAEQDIRVVLYVNQNTRNFQMFRYGRRWHVFINHGESDKMYMTTNQYKAYDYAFIAGDAARERLSRVLWDYDLDRRTIAIGRPQADHYSGALPYTPDERTVVLYAPTWEGDRPSAHYGSIAQPRRGARRARCSRPARHRVIYRPHPRSGVVNPEYGAANRRIIAAHRGGERRRSRRAPRVRRRSRTRLAAGGGRCRGRRHLGDGLRPARRRQAAHDHAARSIRRRSIDTHGYLSACEWLDAAAAPSIVAETDARARRRRGRRAARAVGAPLLRRHGARGGDRAVPRRDRRGSWPSGTPGTRAPTTSEDDEDETDEAELDD